MIESWIEAAMIVFIFVGIAVSIYMRGQANPEGTGTLGRKVNRLDGDVRKLAGEVEDVERRLGEIERTSAKVSDIERVENRLLAHGKKIDGLAETVAAMKAASELRGRQLDMIYQAIVPKGMQ